MKRGLTVCGVALCLTLILALSCETQARVRAPRHTPEQAQTQEPAASKQPKVIKTSYFTLPLSEGWRLIKPVQSAGGSVSVLLGKADNTGAIALNAMKANLSASEIARNMRASMQKDGAVVQEPVDKDGLSVFSFTRKPAKGTIWVGANGKEAAVVTIFGDDQEPAKMLLRNLQPRDRTLFPKF